MSAWKGCSWTPPPDAIVTTRMIHPFFMGGTPTWRNLHRFAMLHILEWVQLTSPQKIVPLPNPSTCDIFVRCFQPFFSQHKCTKNKASMTLTLALKLLVTKSGGSSVRPSKLHGKNSRIKTSNFPSVPCKRLAAVADRCLHGVFHGASYKWPKRTGFAWGLWGLFSGVMGPLPITAIGAHFGAIPKYPNMS